MNLYIDLFGISQPGFLKNGVHFATILIHLTSLCRTWELEKKRTEKKKTFKINLKQYDSDVWKCIECTRILHLLHSPPNVVQISDCIFLWLPFIVSMEGNADVGIVTLMNRDD